MATAFSAWKSSGWEMVVSEIRPRAAIAMSSNPTTDRSRGNVDARLLAGVDQPDRAEVVPDEHGGRSLRAAQRRASGVALRPTRIASHPGCHHSARRRLDAGLAHGVDVARVTGAVAARLDRRGADVADAPMAEVEQVLRREAAALPVVRPDRVGPLLPQADRDHRDVGAPERLRELRRALDQREKDEPGDPLLEQGIDARDRELLVALDVAEHGRVALTEQRPLDDLREVGVVRVAEVADEHADHRRLAFDELARDPVRLVVQLLDHDRARASASRPTPGRRRARRSRRSTWRRRRRARHRRS